MIYSFVKHLVKSSFGKDLIHFITILSTDHMYLEHAGISIIFERVAIQSYADTLLYDMCQAYASLNFHKDLVTLLYRSNVAFDNKQIAFQLDESNSLFQEGIIYSFVQYSKGSWLLLIAKWWSCFYSTFASAWPFVFDTALFRRFLHEAVCKQEYGETNTTDYITQVIQCLLKMHLFCFSKQLHYMNKIKRTWITANLFKNWSLWQQAKKQVMNQCFSNKCTEDDLNTERGLQEYVISLWKVRAHQFVFGQGSGETSTWQTSIHIILHTFPESQHLEANCFITAHVTTNQWQSSLQSVHCKLFKQILL